MLIVKIGGSVITNKGKYRKIRENIIKRLAYEFYPNDSILIHGAGSFGHYLADIHHLNDGLKEENRLEYSKVSRDLQELNTKIIEYLIRNGKPAITLPLHSFHMVGEEFNYRRFVDYIQRGFIPVIYGDIVLDPKKGMSICSGDQIAFHLAKALRPERVIFVTDVDGIYDKNPKVYDDAILLETVSSKDNIQFDGIFPDVTGSMEGKMSAMRAIARLGIDVLVINGLVRGRLRRAMVGDYVKGTRVLP